MTLIEAADFLRWLAFILGIAVALVLVRLLVNINITKRPLIRVTRIAIVLIAMATISVTYTEYQFLGTRPTFRLPLNLAILTTSIVYLHRVLKLPREQWNPPGYDGEGRKWWSSRPS